MKNRLFSSLLLFLILIAGGTLGYMSLTEATAFEALYMTIISVTTVGYSETVPMANTPAVRLFTIFILLTGMGVTLYFASTLTAFLVEGELQDILWSRKMKKEIGNLNQHVIVAGGGQTAYYAIKELLHTRNPFVVIEKEQENYQYLLDHFHSPYLLGIIGDATEDETLLRAGIQRAKGLITTLPEDKDNVFVTITARGLNPDVKIISKSVYSTSTNKIKMAGADDVICPDSIGGMRMVSQLLRPHVVSFLDTMLAVTHQQIRIEEIPIQKSRYIGKKIFELNLPGQFGDLLVLALRPQNSEVPLYNPKDAKLRPGDTLIVMGDLEWIKKARDYLTRQ